MRGADSAVKTQRVCPAEKPMQLAEQNTAARHSCLCIWGYLVGCNARVQFEQSTRDCISFSQPRRRLCRYPNDSARVQRARKRERGAKGTKKASEFGGWGGDGQFGCECRVRQKEMKKYYKCYLIKKKNYVAQKQYLASESTNKHY